MSSAGTVTRGSGNVFADVGIANPVQHKAKAQIVMLIGDAIRRAGLTQAAAGERLGLKQPDVSNLLRGRFSGYSLERLLGMLIALDHRVSIDVEVANENDSPSKVVHLEYA